LKLSGSASAIAAHLGHKHTEIKNLMEDLDQKKKKSFGVSSEATISAVSFQDASQKKPKLNQDRAPLPSARPGAKSNYQPKSKKSTSIELQKQAQVKQIISEGLPLRHAECHWYRRLIETTAGAGRAGATLDDLLVSNREMEARLEKTSKDLHSYLQERIMGKPVCASVEHRELPNKNLMYTSSSVHWIENFQLSSAVLAATLSTAGSASTELASMLKQWGLMPKVKFVVADPAVSTADVPGIVQLPCVDSLLAEIASIAFDDMVAIDTGDDDAKSGDSLLATVRELVDFFEGSIEASDELMGIASKLTVEGHKLADGLVSDCSKTWWSTMIMLQRLLGLREAVTVFVSRQWERKHSPSKLPSKFNNHDWNALEKLFLALRPLRFSCQILGKRNKTASLIPLVVLLIYRELETLVESSQKDNLPTWQKMLYKMNTLFGDFPSRHYQEGGKKHGKKCKLKLSREILIAHALDPRFKNLSIFPADVQELVWSDVLEHMERARPESPLKPTELTQPQATKESNQDVKKTTSAGSAELDSLFQLYSQEQTIKQQEQPPSVDWSQKCKMELKQYQEADGGGVDLESNVLLDWWGKSSFGHFPVLWGLAQTFLSIPATASPPSRAFEGRRFSRDISRADGIVNFLCENISTIEEDYWQVRRSD